MRITNTMMTNNILYNINKNREQLSVLEQQMATGKKIQKPSDDPIIAIRALKFRTTVSEIDQYVSNAEDAVSWENITEQAVSNVTEIVKKIRELSVQATSDTMTIENRKNIITEIEQLQEQFLSEGNATYAGRHIFSGFNTDTPLVFTEESTDQYTLTQTFDAEDVEVVQRVVDDVIIDVNRIRLGYSDVENTDPTPFTTLPFTALNSLDSSDANAYTPAVGEVNFLEDTGELIFNEADVANIPDPLDFEFEKTGFEKGDLAPEHYFTGTNITTGSTFTLEKDEMLYQISYSQEISVNTMGYDLVSIDMARDIEELINTTKNIAADSSLTSALEEDLLGDMFDELMGKMDTHIDKLLETRTVIGSKINRLELTISRLGDDKLNFTDLLSKNEDADAAEVIIKLASQETVYNASLSAAAKIIQKTLLDFIG